MTDELPEPALTPAEEAVRRALADARHTDPIPGDVAARLDAVLSDLVADRADLAAAPVLAAESSDDSDASDDGADVVEGAPVLSLAAERRRRRGARLLLAAAAVVVAGVGLTQVDLDGAIGPTSDGDSAGMAESAPEPASSYDAGSGALQNLNRDGRDRVEPALPLPDLSAASQPPQPGAEPYAPEGAAKSPWLDAMLFTSTSDAIEEDLHAGNDEGYLSGFTASRVSRLTLAKDAAFAQRRAVALDATTPLRSAAVVTELFSAATCRPRDPYAHAIAVRFQGRPAVLIYRSPFGGTQRVDLYRCTSGGPAIVESALIAVPD